MERALTFRQDYAGVEPVRARAVDAPTTDYAAVDAPADSGVTIHRGRAFAYLSVDAAAPRPRLMTASGVRIHIGARHAGMTTDATAALPLSSISEETDPT